MTIAVMEDQDVDEIDDLPPSIKGTRSTWPDEEIPADARADIAKYRGRPLDQTVSDDDIDWDELYGTTDS